MSLNPTKNSSQCSICKYDPFNPVTSSSAERSDGTEIEDLGIKPDVPHNLTPEDLENFRAALSYRMSPARMPSFGGSLIKLAKAMRCPNDVSKDTTHDPHEPIGILNAGTEFPHGDFLPEPMKAAADTQDSDRP